MASDAEQFHYSPRHSFSSWHGKCEWGAMRPQDYAVQRLLDEIDSALEKLADANESATVLLLQLRPAFSQVLEDFPRTGIRRWLAEHGAKRPGSPVAVWLLGKSSAATTTKRIAELVDQPMTYQFAKHYARALQRLRLWEALDALCVRFPNEETITRYTDAGRSQPFADRLRRFSANVDQSHAAEVPERSRMPLWLSAEFWRRTPGKTARAIRRLLDDIHRLVHGA